MWDESWFIHVFSSVKLYGHTPCLWSIVFYGLPPFCHLYNSLRPHASQVSFTCAAEYLLAKRVHLLAWLRYTAIMIFFLNIPYQMNSLTIKYLERIFSWCIWGPNLRIVLHLKEHLIRCIGSASYCLPCTNGLVLELKIHMNFFQINIIPFSPWSSSGQSRRHRAMQALHQRKSNFLVSLSSICGPWHYTERIALHIDPCSPLFSQSLLACKEYGCRGSPRAEWW